MKKILMMLLAGLLLVFFTSCAKNVDETSLPVEDLVDGTEDMSDIMEPELLQMQQICDVAVMECYYHNVTKYHLDDAEKFLWIKKDMDFWIEYDAIATLGVDGERLQMEVSGNHVRVKLPQAELLNCNIVSEETEVEYYVARDSAEVNAEHEINAFKDAKEDLQVKVQNDTDLMQSARNRVKLVLEKYIMTIGKKVGKNYNIEWVDID